MKFDTAITGDPVYKQRKISEFQDSGSQVIKQGCSMTGFLEKSGEDFEQTVESRPTVCKSCTNVSVRICYCLQTNFLQIKTKT